MSANDFFNVWNHSNHKGSDLLILLAIASYADEFGFAWPQLDTIAKQARVDRRTITRRIPHIIGCEMIYFQESAHLYQKAKRSARSNLYIVLLNRDPYIVAQILNLYKEISQPPPPVGGTLSSNDNQAKVDNLTTLLGLVMQHGGDIFADKLDDFAGQVDSFAAEVVNLPTDSFKDSFKEKDIDSNSPTHTNGNLLNQFIDAVMWPNHVTKLQAESNLVDLIILGNEASIIVDRNYHYWLNAFTNRSTRDLISTLSGQTITAISVELEGGLP